MEVNIVFIKNIKTFVELSPTVWQPDAKQVEKLKNAVEDYFM